ncbi:DExH-box ATP-dependent RNA helicase DExH12 [Turnera subulata]|uniref:RNA helicase n=1 Tax=Turnera subulata TaxID=218843 RepID=A0A9Q0J2D3_9ROSI|nr:DExH-box ATP-dependent RNA helicase DExH12 [Turnera subulata]
MRSQLQWHTRNSSDPRSGEPQSLRGKIDPKRFGDRAFRGRPTDLEEKRRMSRQRMGREDGPPPEPQPKRRRRLREESVLTADEEEGLVYRPKTQASHRAYESMLNIIQRQLGDQPLGVVTSAADGILAVLKNESMNTHCKKEEIEVYITDYHGRDGDDDVIDAAELDDGAAMAVVFDDDDEGEEESDGDDVDLISEEEDDDAAEYIVSRPLRVRGDDELMGEADFDVGEIDAYWLQRKFSSQVSGQRMEPEQSRKLAEEVLEILAEGEDDTEVERNLLLLLHQVDMLKIVWCTRLARANGEEERRRIEAEMMASGPDLVAIVEQLRARGREKNLEKSIVREEVVSLKDVKRAKEQPRLLDLDSIAFEKGDRLMTRNSCDLPPGSFQHERKGYVEIHVPGLKPQALEPDGKFVKISDMPAWAQPAFEGMPLLNRIQSKVYETALFHADNILLCAPTGAGKTNVVLLTILQQIGLHRKLDDSYDHNDLCCAPMKALVAGVVGNLSNRLRNYGVVVRELSGDHTLTRHQIEEAQVIVTTPEKWDIFTRKSGDPTYAQNVKLLIIDEIHILHDNRGPVLESIVARTVRQIEATGEHIRLVGLSATLPNFEDVASILRVDVKKGLFHFDNSYRPAPLSQQYIGIYRYQLLNDICYEKVMNVAGKHQVLIFVHSRKETTMTARAIRDKALASETISRFLREDSVSREILQSETDILRNNDLKDLLPYGFAIHHAGMTRGDRDIVEDLFKDGNIQVLVSTVTLAWGVNLPARIVIINGTQIYNPEKGAWTELSPLDVIEACNWLRYTYLYVRMLRNPTLYGLAPDILTRDTTLEERRADLIHSAATVLEKNNLVKYEKKSGCFQATDLGRIASYYYVTHGTISTYNELLKPTMGDIELCHLFTLSEEFKYVTVRQDEKMELAKLLDRVPIPIKESPEDPSAKINILLQAYISKLKLEGLSLTSDMVFITQSAGWLMRALFEIVLKRGWAQLAEKALNLSKMFHGIPSEILMKLEKKDLVWERYYDLSAQQVGELICFQKLGRTLHKYIHQFPKVNLTAHVQPITRTVQRVELTITPDFVWEDSLHGYVEPFWVFVEDNDGDHILHHEYFMLKKQYSDEDHSLNFTVPIYEPLPPGYMIRVVSDKWLGSQTVLPVTFRHLILPERYHPPTELLDLQPLPVAALRNPLYEALYQDFKHFNPAQTQVFIVLYNTDDNVMVAAPTRSGKTICAEFAILRSHQKGPESVLRVIIELTGEPTMDLKLLERGQIIISTPERWDALSRRWKQRKFVQHISLFLIDELHLIGSQGATSQGLFNFPPSVRPVPLEIHIQGVDIVDFEARMQAMAKPTYTSTVQHGENGKPAIVFVPTRKHVRLAVRDLITYSIMDNKENPAFLLHSPEELEPFTGKIQEEMLRVTLCHGVGYLHEGLSNSDQEVVSQLFETGWIQVCVMSSSMCWRVPLSAHLVVVMGTQYHEGLENAPIDYPLPDLLQMMGHASQPLLDNSGKCVLLCHSPQKEYYKKFLFEAFPVESHLHHFLQDNFNAEVVAGVIKTKQDALVTGIFSDHLSELVENALSDLEDNKFIEIKDDTDLYPLNLGRIASYYYVSCITVERFSSLLTPKTKTKGLLEILTLALEYAQLPIRSGEEGAHFSRQFVRGILAMDQQEVILSASRLLQAMVDVVSNNGWLNLALLAMEVSQMLTQGMWERDSMLLQLPYFTEDLIKKCIQNPGKSIETVSDLVEMEDDCRRELLQMSDSQLLDIAIFCNRFPNIDLSYEVMDSGNVRAGADITLLVTLERDLQGRTEVGPVNAARYPNAKEEGWWLVVGDTERDQLLAIKRVLLQRKSKTKLEFAAPAEGGSKSYTLYFMCDSYLGCDQEYSFDVDVRGE